MNFLLGGFTNNVLYDFANSVCANHVLKLLTFGLSDGGGNFIQFNVRVLENLFESLYWIIRSCHVKRNFSSHAFELFWCDVNGFVIESNRNRTSKDFLYRRWHTCFKLVPVVEYVFKVFNSWNFEILKIFDVFHLLNGFIDILLISQSKTFKIIKRLIQLILII